MNPSPLPNPQPWLPPIVGVQQAAPELFGAAPQVWNIREDVRSGIDRYPAVTTSQPVGRPWREELTLDLVSVSCRVLLVTRQDTTATGPAASPAAEHVGAP